MYQIVTPADRNQHSHLLNEMFLHRYKIVVEEWGWEIPGITPPLEKDQFDTDETVYILVRDDELGRITASSRLNPTTKPHMMSELFSDFCTLQPYPVSPAAWEWSRLVFDRRAYKDRARELKIRTALSLGIHQFCTDAGIRELSYLTHHMAYNLVQKVWDTEPLGLPKQAEDQTMTWIAAKSKVDQAAYHQLIYRHENAEAIIAKTMAGFIEPPQAEAA